MSSHTNRSNVENARRFLWDTASGTNSGDRDARDVESASSAASRPHNRRTNLSARATGSSTGTGFSTRDFNVVDQSVNLMDLGNASSSKQTKRGGKSSSGSGGGMSGLFRAKMESENLSRFTDEYGDADASADAEEYIETRKRRVFGVAAAFWGLGPKKKAKILLTLVVAIMALVLVSKSFRSFEELEEEAAEQQKQQQQQQNNNNKQDNTRLDRIKDRILREGVSPAGAFGSQSPQQRALEWIASQDPAQLDPDHKGLLDRYGLAVMRFAMPNPKAFPDADWLNGSGICQWYGIECLPREQEATAANGYEPFTTRYDDNYYVTSIQLPSAGIEGILVDELGTAFLELLTINLEDNQLSGSLPEALAKAPHLKDLLLAKNQLTGTLPQAFSTMKNLHQLSLSHNLLKGPLWEDWEDGLTKLRYFGASHNQLTGSLPDLTKLTRLTGLYLEGNQLKGDLPESLEGMTSLLDLKIGQNKFSGPIDVLSALSNLETLNLAENEFTGTIPDMFDQLYRLHELVLAGNKFQGSIPLTLTHLQVLKTLNLDANQLEGSLPPGLGLLTDIVTLSLGNNRFEGTLPTLLGKLDDIQTLLLNHNELSGPIPTELGLCFRLSTLHLEDNHLTGDIPAELGDLKDLSKVRLEENDFGGATMPPQICALRDDDLSVLTADCKNTDQLNCDCCTECH